MPRGGNHLKTYPKDFKQSAIEMAISSDRPMSHTPKQATTRLLYISSKRGVCG